MSKLNNPALAQEVVQDAFLEAVKNIDKLMSHENPKGWIKNTVKYKVKHAERSFNRYILRFISLDTDIPFEDARFSIGDGHNPNMFDIMEKIHRILTSDEWDLLRKIALEKVPYKDVSAELGITVWTCQKRVQRIREKLREKFKDDLY